jgi:Rrf2 family protein
MSVKLEITRKTDLATRALLVLAQVGRRSKSNELAEEIGTTPGFLAHVMAPLVTRRWVHSEPGPAGGYVTAVDLSEINVLEVIEAVEGPTDTGHCVLEERTCLSGGPCALHQPWSRARNQLLGELAATPLSTLPAPSRVAARNQGLSR